MLLTIKTSGEILDLFSADTPERGVTEVGAELGVSKSKAHALLSSLATVGLLRRTERGRYRIGWRALSLGRVLEETTDFAAHSRPVMDVLAAHLGETVHLATLDSGRVVYVARVEGSQPAPTALSAAGSILLAHGSAVGKMLLSRLDDAELSETVKRHGLPAQTPRTITSISRLREELGEVRDRGFALDRGETFAEISCVAAPIIGVGPEMVAALSVSAPPRQFERKGELYRRIAIRAARSISRRLCEAQHAAETPPAPAQLVTRA